MQKLSTVAFDSASIKIYPREPCFTQTHLKIRMKSSPKQASEQALLFRQATGARPPRRDTREGINLRSLKEARAVVGHSRYSPRLVSVESCTVHCIHPPWTEG